MNAKHAPPMLAPSSLQISLLLRAVNEAEPELAPSCCLSISAGRLPCHSQSYLQVTVNPTCRLPCHSQSYLQVGPLLQAIEVAGVGAGKADGSELIS